VAQRYKFRHAPWVAEVETAPLTEAAVLVRQYRPLPQMPGIERDLALVVDEGVPWRDLEATIREASPGELEQVAFLNLYRGKQVPKGKKSLALRLVFRAEDATLTREQADAFQERIVSRLTKKLGAELRAGEQ